MVESRMIKAFEDTQVRLRLSEQEKLDILSLKDIIGENNISLQADGKFMIRHYVGFYQCGKTRLLVYPKISRQVTDEESYNKAFNILVKMLGYSGFLSVARLNSAQQFSKFNGDILELYIYLFADELIKLLKRDVNRSYNNTQDNLSFIKGKIDNKENTKQNSYRRHLHAVSYEEFTENILLNQILKAVIERLIKRATNKENRIKLRQCLLWLEDVQKIRITPSIWDRVLFTRLNRQYETVFNMARLFYYNSSWNLNKGDEATFSFLVPVHQLFEKYTYELIKSSVDSSVQVIFQGPQRFLACEQRAIQLKPDISLIKDNQACLIIDTKYKEIVDNQGKCMVAQSDIYQMLAYSVRYDCSQIILAYPKMLGCYHDDMELFHYVIENNQKKINIRMVQIDLEENAKNMSGQLFSYIEKLNSVDSSLGENRYMRR